MKNQKPPQKHTNTDDTTTPTITLFVYGTLRSGHANHARFCRNAIDIQPATTRGRLYLLPAGYPALEVPESAILAHGTTDPLADAITQVRLAASLPPHSAQHRLSASRCPYPGDWELVHGEILTFPNPPHDLPPIDRLEGFRPGSDSFYLRVLVSVAAHSRSLPAWLYTAADAHTYLYGVPDAGAF